MTANDEPTEVGTLKDSPFGSSIFVPHPDDEGGYVRRASRLIGMSDGSVRWEYDDRGGDE